MSLDPKLGQSKNKYAGGVLLPSTTNIDTFDFGCRIMKHAEQMGVGKLMNTKFETFVFDGEQKKKIVGIKTSQGVIPCNNVIVCAGLYSPYILDKLGMRLPIIPLKGYSFTQDKEEAHNFKLCHLDYNNNIGITAWKKKVRWTSFCTDIMGIDYTIPKQRIDRTIKAHDNLMNGNAKLDLSQVWTGMRPLTPDDVPIISRVPKFPQVIINSGHGSKGGS